MRRANHPQGTDLQDTCCLRQVTRDCSDLVAVNRSVTGVNQNLNPNLLRHYEVCYLFFQILPTIPSASVRAASSGIRVELNEVEARNEEFPMTLSFLRMIDTLTDTPVPAGLGAGYRAPGFQPYLDFLRDEIFIKFNTRAYKNPSEKVR